MAFSSAGGDLEADAGATGVVVRETKGKETGAQMVADSTLTFVHFKIFIGGV